MNTRQSTSLARQLFAAADRLGATIPEPLAAEHQRIADLAETTRRLDLGADIPGAVLAALEAGHDVATDPGVVAAVISGGVNLYAPGIEERVGQRAEQFLTDHADELLVMFTEPFDTAAATIGTALDRLGNLALEDSDAVLAQGGDAATVWATAQQADKVITDITSLWKGMSVMTHRGVVNPTQAALIIADIPPAVMADDPPDSKARPWDLARAGYPLALVDGPGFDARLAAVDAEHQRRQAEAEENRKYAMTGRRRPVPTTGY